MVRRCAGLAEIRRTGRKLAAPGPEDCRSVTGDGRGNGDVVDGREFGVVVICVRLCHNFEMSQQDGAAVVAYLKAVKPEPK